MAGENPSSNRAAGARGAAEMIRAAAVSNVATSRAAAVAVLHRARENNAVHHQAREGSRVAGANRGHANKAALPASRVAIALRQVQGRLRVSRVKTGVVVIAVAATGTRATVLRAIGPRVVTEVATGVAIAAVANNARPDRPKKTSSDTAYIIYIHSKPFCLQDGFLFFNFN